MSERQVSFREYLEDLQQRAADGDAEALWSLAQAYDDDEFTQLYRKNPKPDRRKAVKLYRLAAQKGYPAAMVSLAICLYSGHGAKKDPQEAFRWEKRAAQQGDITAINNVAIAYRDFGKHRLAVQWFRRALALGVRGAELELAKAELLGRGTRRDIESGLRRLRNVGWASTPYISVAEKEEAAITGARIYLDGWLVPRDLDTAMRWLRKAAETDNEEAIGLLRELER